MHVMVADLVNWHVLSISKGFFLLGGALLKFPKIIVLEKSVGIRIQLVIHVWEKVGLFV